MTATGSFKDYFSDQSARYARYRPHYPRELFTWLARESSGHLLAWDCATGNGQSAISLVDHFARVIATDASEAQIAAAMPHPAVDYRVATAENSGLDDASVDLITVGQALHWFEHDRFFAEAARVLRPGGLLAMWSYQLCHVRPDIDAVIDRLYVDITGPFWLPERDLVDSGYDGIEFPAPLLDVPAFDMRVTWGVDDMLGYLRTWSASKRYSKARGGDPVALIEPELRATWGVAAHDVIWPLTVCACRPSD